MRLSPVRGKYIVAVSGGVDSVVLLDLLKKQQIESHGLELAVAHFDHGIRDNSNQDLLFVKKLADKYGLKFLSAQGHLGKNASEQKARKARYEFLNSALKTESAEGLITAHHQDDLIETAILNLIRGTGRKGLSSLSSSGRIVRPLLSYPKGDIIKYAKDNKLTWHEDPTNQDIKYLRNYIRHQIVPKLNSNSRIQLLDLIKKQAVLNSQIDKELTNILNLRAEDNRLPRLWLNSLDSSLSREILAAWLRQNGLRSFDRATIERLASQLKTLHPGKRVDVFSGWQVSSTRGNLALEYGER